METGEVEAVLIRHPLVRGSVVTRIPTARDKDVLVAYIETDEATPEQIRIFLAEQRLPAEAAAVAVIPMRALPRSATGAVDRGALPLPPLASVSLGKGIDLPQEPLNAWLVAWLAVPCAVVAYLLTDLFWPGSTNLTAYWAPVPSPWAELFRVLYVFECLSFGIGVAFLILGWSGTARLGRPGDRTWPAHLSIAWLLMAWWPQDNFYRLAEKTDWPRQAALVYSFNITLMIAAAVVAAYVVRGRRVSG